MDLGWLFPEIHFISCDVNQQHQQLRNHVSELEQQLKDFSERERSLRESLEYEKQTNSKCSEKIMEQNKQIKQLQARLFEMDVLDDNKQLMKQLQSCKTSVEVQKCIQEQQAFVRRVQEQLRKFVSKESDSAQSCEVSQDGADVPDCTQKRLEKVVEQLLDHIRKVESQKQELVDRVKNMQPLVRIQAHNYNKNYNAYLKEEVTQLKQQLSQTQVELAQKQAQLLFLPQKGTPFADDQLLEELAQKNSQIVLLQAQKESLERTTEQLKQQVKRLVSTQTQFDI